MTPIADALSNTHQKFRKWLDTTFCDGKPTEEEWQAILEEDREMTHSTAGCEMEEIYEETEVQEQLYLHGELEGDQVQLEGDQVPLDQEEEH